MNDGIREWDTINKIELLERKIFNKSGIKPNNVSHWNSAADFQKLLKEIYKPTDVELELYLDYNFTYDVTNVKKRKIIGQLGLDKSIMGLVVPTGTIAINCTLNWLKESCKITNIAILCPAYFAVFHICDVMGINYHEIYMKKDANGKYKIPQAELISLISEKKIDAIYITNPVYCTSSYLDNSDLEFLNNILDRKKVDQEIRIIWDGCLSIKKNPYVSALCSKENVVSIFEPHKPLAINGSKFCVVCFKYKELSFFESRADIIYGGLSASNLIALNHYLSPNYNECLKFFLKESYDNYCKILELSSKYNNVEIDDYDHSLYISCYFPRVSSEHSYRTDFLSKMITESQCSFIPGRRNHFDPNLPFSFRINLTRCDDEVLNMLNKIFSLLDQFEDER